MPLRLRIDLQADVVLTFERRRKPEKVRLVILNEQGEVTTMESISVDKKRTLTVAGLRTTPAGDKPARLDGVPVWTADKTGIVGLFPTPDGMSCDVTNIGPGTCIVTVTADADLSAGTRDVVATVDIECKEGEADKLAITVGPEVDL